MKLELVTLIVPVYNVEQYLEKCIESLICQTYSNIEILLIDDGSTDNSGIICDRYASKDKRIKVIHKNNGGLSEARNFGIEAGRGKYLMFIDSDDWIDKEYVEQFHKLITKYNADIVIGKLKTTFSNKCVAEKKTYEKIVSKHEIYKEMFLQDGSIISACAKMYKKDVFIDCKYDVGKLYEDFLIFDTIIEKVNKIVKFDYAGYFYYIRNNSIMRSAYNPERWILIEKSKEYIKLCEEKYPDLKNAAIRKYIVSCYGILSRSIIDKKNNDVSKKIRNLIKQYNKEIFTLKEFNKKDRLQAILINLGIKPYRFSLYVYNRLKK